MENITVLSDGEKVVLLNPNIPSWISLTTEGYEVYQSIIDFGIDKTKLKYNVSAQELYELKNEIDSVLFQKITEINQLHPVNAATVFLTDACNFKCKHCFYSCGENRNYSFLDYGNIYKHFIQDFVNAGGKFITFTGGEPLLNTNFEKYVEYAVSNNIQCMLLTNGSLLSEQLCKFLSENNIKVQVSVDGNKDSFPIIRQGGNYGEIIKNLKLLKKNNVDFDISFMPCKINVDSFKDVINLGIKYNASGIHIPFLENYGSANNNIDKLLLSEKEQEEFVCNLIDEYFGRGLRKKILIENFESIVNVLTQGTRKISCQLGSSTGALTPDGSLYPCSEIIEEKFRVGKYDKNEFYPSNSDNKLSFTVDKIENCKDCIYRYYCGGGCRLHSYLKYGTFTREDSDCRLLKMCYEKILLWIA